MTRMSIDKGQQKNVPQDPCIFKLGTSFTKPIIIKKQ